MTSNGQWFVLIFGFIGRLSMTCFSSTYSFPLSIICVRLEAFCIMCCRKASIHVFWLFLLHMNVCMCTFTPTTTFIISSCMWLSLFGGSYKHTRFFGNIMKRVRLVMKKSLYFFLMQKLWNGCCYHWIDLRAHFVSKRFLTHEYDFCIYVVIESFVKSTTVFI